MLLNSGKSILLWVSLLFFSLSILHADELQNLTNSYNAKKQEYLDYIKRFSAEDQKAKSIKNEYLKLEKQIKLLKIINSDDNFTSLSPDTEINDDFLIRLSSGDILPNAQTDYILGWLNFKYYSLQNALSLFNLSLLKYSSYTNIPKKLYLSIALVYFRIAESSEKSKQNPLFTLCKEYIKKAGDLSHTDYSSIADTLEKKADAYIELNRTKKK